MSCIQFTLTIYSGCLDLPSARKMDENGRISPNQDQCHDFRTTFQLISMMLISKNKHIIIYKWFIWPEIQLYVSEVSPFMERSRQKKITIYKNHLFIGIS